MSSRGPPHVAFVGVDPGGRGGIAQFGANLARAVGDDAQVAVISYRRLYPRLSPAGRQPPDPGVPPAPASASSILVPWEPSTWRAAARELERFAPGLVVFQWWSPLFGPCVRYLARRVRRSGARVVMVCHNAQPHEAFPLSRRLTTRALREGDALVALSHPVAGELAGLVPGALPRVLAHPPNLPPTTSCNGETWGARLAPLEGSVILFFGNVREYKGLSDLIAALPPVRRQLPVTLVVAGEFFQPLVRFERQAESLGIRDAIRFWPRYVPSDEAPGLFELCDLVALPYRRASQSGVVAQAAQAGKPVVATTVGGLPEALGDGAVLAPPGRPGALAEALTRALREPPAPPRLAGSWHEWRSLLLAEAAG